LTKGKAWKGDNNLGTFGMKAKSKCTTRLPRNIDKIENNAINFFPPFQSK